MPCKWCSPSSSHAVQKVLAYVASAYLLASVVYLLSTAWIGTPFRDSLTEEQRRIKKNAACVRGASFGAGLALSILVLALWRPF